MRVELGIVISIISVIFVVISFVLGRTTSSNQSGREWGEMKTDIKHIKDDVSEIKFSVSLTAKDLNERIAQEEIKRKKSIEKLYLKLEKHIEECHKHYVIKE